MNLTPKHTVESIHALLCYTNLSFIFFVTIWHIHGSVFKGLSCKRSMDQSSTRSKVILAMFWNICTIFQHSWGIFITSYLSVARQGNKDCPELLTWDQGATIVKCVIYLFTSSWFSKKNCVLIVLVWTVLIFIRV